MSDAKEIEQANPGSDKAVAQGCTCPRMDNGYGRGYHSQEGVFVCSEDCKMHGGRVMGEDNEAGGLPPTKDTDLEGTVKRCSMCGCDYIHPHGAVAGLGKCSDCFMMLWRSMVGPYEGEEKVQ